MEPELILEPDIELAIDTGRCPRCDSGNVKMHRELESAEAFGVWGGKPYQRLERFLYVCEHCLQMFAVNRPVTL
jgi:hypothetical protein